MHLLKWAFVLFARSWDVRERILIFKKYSCHLHFLVHGSQHGLETSETKPEEQKDYFAFSTFHHKLNKNAIGESQTEEKKEKNTEVKDSDNKKMLQTGSERICTTQAGPKEDLKTVGDCSGTEPGLELHVGTDRTLDTCLQEQDSLYDQEEVSVGFIQGIFGVLYKG